MKEFIETEKADNNITLSLNKNQLKEVVINNFSTKTLKKHSDSNKLMVETDFLKQLKHKDSEISALENKIVDLQNTILILENDLELNILQNIETIIKQEEFLLEINQVISNLEMKNENYQTTILKQKKELKKVNGKYQKLKKSKFGSLVVKYWEFRRKVKSR